MNKKLLITLIPLGFFLLLAILFWRGLSLNPRELPSVLIGKKVPAFELTTLDGKPINEKIFQGKVTLLNVWASWCLTCRVEHEQLMKIAQSKQIVVMGLNYKDQLSAANNWLKTFGNPYAINIYDPKGSLALNLGVYGVPETYIIDKQGVIRYKHIGEVKQQDWEGEMGEVVNEL